MHRSIQKPLMICSVITVFALGFWVVTYAVGESGIVTVCVNRAGIMRLKEAGSGRCLRGETEVSWNSQGPAGPQGLPGEKGEKGDTGAPGPVGTPFHLRDANKQDLGILLNVDSDTYTTYLPDLEVSVVGVFREEATGPTLQFSPLYRDMWFDEANCSGNSFVIDYPVPGHPLSIHGIYKVVDGTYVAMATSTPVRVTVVSSLKHGACQNILPEATTTDQATTTYPMRVITLPFREPLAWPPRIVSQ